MSKEFNKKPIAYLILALLLLNHIFLTGCGIVTSKETLMNIYKSESEKVLLQHPEVNTIVTNNLSSDTYPFKLSSYIDTAKNMYGRDMTDEDFAYCSILGWGVLKTFEKQHPDVYKLATEKLKPFLIIWYNKYTENKKSIIDDFLMKVSFWTVYFNSERLTNGDRIASLPLTGDKIIYPDSEVGLGEIVFLQSLLWIETYKVEYDVSGTNWYDGNILNSFGITREIYKTLRHNKDNYLLSDANGWNIRGWFCGAGLVSNYLSRCIVDIHTNESGSRLSIGKTMSGLAEIIDYSLRGSLHCYRGVEERLDIVEKLITDLSGGRITEDCFYDWQDKHIIR